MEFTCLSNGKDFHFPPCHILDICGFRVLFDCPMDLSSLTVFLPIPMYTSTIANQDSFLCCEKCADSSSIKSERLKTDKPLDANSLICALPRYKMVKNLLLWDISLIDLVLISSPMGILGLPYLTRNKDFSAKVYATEAAARIGLLIMEDLVNTHMEFWQFYGPVECDSPLWMKWDELESIPLELRQVICGAEGRDFGGWMALYSDDKDSSAMFLNDDEYVEEMEKIDFICSCSLDSLKEGGSVLIPIGRLGVILQLLDHFALHLASENMKVPIFVVSSVAEELMAFTSIIPEWLCEQLQDRLYSGRPLFAHMEMLKDGRLHLLPAIHSIELLKIWQEPCIVFCPHWSLRLGPVIHLLQRWRGDPNSLLVMEDVVDAGLALLPFKPMVMKVLQCSFLSGLQLQKTRNLLQILQPRHALFPDILKKHMSSLETSFSFGYYHENETIRIPHTKENSEFDISIELACQLKYLTLKQEEEVNIAKLKGELLAEQGKYRLLAGSKQITSRLRPEVLHFGRVKANSLLTCLRELGMNAAVEEVRGGADGAHLGSVVTVTEPGRAVVEVTAAQTSITSGDENMAALISGVVCRILDAHAI